MNAADDMAGPECVVGLPHHHACVFFEWLTRCEEAGQLPFEHEAERIVVWKVQAALEKQVLGSFRPDYHAWLQRLRGRIVDEPL